MKIRNNRIILFIYAFSFLTFFIVFYLTPHNVDDVTYDYLNLTNASDIFSYCAGYGNGRILGNAIACILCKSKLLNSFFRATVITLLPALIAALSTRKNGSNIVAYLFSMLMILAMDSQMFGYTVVWICAFANYIVPVFITLISLLLFKNIKNKEKGNSLKMVLLFTLGFITQLFSENTTVYTVILATLLIIANKVYKMERGKAGAVYLSSSLFGAGVMLYARRFIHSELGYQFQNVNNYQKVPESISSFIDIFQKSLMGTVKYISHNFLLFAVISICFLLLINKLALKD